MLPAKPLMRPDEPLMTPECLLLPCAQAQGDLISSSAQHGVRGSRQASERAAEDASGERMAADEALMSQSVPRAPVRGVCATSSAHQLNMGSEAPGRRASEQRRMRQGGPSAHWSPDVLFAHKDISHDSQYKVYTLNFEEFQHFRPGIAKERL